MQGLLSSSVSQPLRRPSSKALRPDGLAVDITTKFMLQQTPQWHQGRLANVP